MYFKDRAAAGRILLDKVDTDKYQRVNCAVIALTPGAVIIGAQFAIRLHASLSMLLTENITMPGEHTPLAAITPDNTFTYNNKFSTGEIEEMRTEFMSVIEGQRLEKLHHLHTLLGHGGEIHREILDRHVVILVSDGLSNGFSLDVASDYLKPVNLKRLIVVTPIASVPAVDKMHLVGDEIACLSVLDNYMNTNHYYEDNTIPPMEDLTEVIVNMPLHWDRQSEKSAKEHHLL